MAAVAPSPDQAADLLKNLSLESHAKPSEIPEPTKKASGHQYGGVESGNFVNGQTQSFERSLTPSCPDLCYFPNGYPFPAYFCGSYDGSGNHWGDYSRYVNTDGPEIIPGVHGDNGTTMYHNGYAYTPYVPYSPVTTPVPTMGNEDQLYLPQPYQYPHYFQPLVPTTGLVVPGQEASSQGELASTTAPEEKPLNVEAAIGNLGGIVNGGGVEGNGGATLYKPTYQNFAHNFSNPYGSGSWPGVVPGSFYQDPKFSFKGQYGGTGPLSKSKNDQSMKSNNFRRHSNFMGYHYPGPVPCYGSTHSFINKMYPNNFCGPYEFGMGFGYGGYNSKLNAQWWFGVDAKYKARGHGNSYYGYRNESIDGLDERHRGPRAEGYKSQKGLTPVTQPLKGQIVPPSEAVGDEKDEKYMTPDREQYKLAEFPEHYVDAKFFVIKSYSEDDVHKSVKYGVWSSTPNGNKKLDAAYREVQQKSGSCPIFLLFSVNTSGQFVGLAEMVGPVDFDKNIEYWQQDKWTGCFPVKWHIVKDIPNSLLKHITLENNENKPVTNSRDTQEVMLDQGLKIIKIFKEHSSKTCILDDFTFYEKRQKIIHEKKAKQRPVQKQALPEKVSDEKKAAAANVSNKSPEVVSDLEEPHLTSSSNGDLRPLGV